MHVCYLAYKYIVVAIHPFVLSGRHIYAESASLVGSTNCFAVGARGHAPPQNPKALSTGSRILPKGARERLPHLHDDVCELFLFSSTKSHVTTIK